MKHLAISLSLSLIALTFSACNDKTDSAVPAAEQSTQASEAIATKVSNTEEKASDTAEKVESQVKNLEDTQSTTEQKAEDSTASSKNPVEYSGNTPNDLPIASTEAITELTDSIEEVVQDSIQEAVSSAVGDEVQKKADK
jgi:hypothetical protein